MESIASTKAASAQGPIASAYAASHGGTRGIFRQATSTTAGGLALPTQALDDGRTGRALAGKWALVKNESAVYTLTYAWGIGSLPVPVAGQLADWTTGSAAAGWVLEPGETHERMIPEGATHIGWVQPAGAAASTIAIVCAEGQVTG